MTHLSMHLGLFELVQFLKNCFLPVLHISCWFLFSHVLLCFVMVFPTMPFSRRLFLTFCWYSIQSTPRAFLLVIIFGQWFLLDFYVDESNDSFISSFHCLYVLFFSILNSFTHSPVQCWLASVIVGVLILILLWKCF